MTVLHTYFYIVDMRKLIVVYRKALKIIFLQLFRIAQLQHSYRAPATFVLYPKTQNNEFRRVFSCVCLSGVQGSDFWTWQLGFQSFEEPAASMFTAEISSSLKTKVPVRSTGLPLFTARRSDKSERVVTLTRSNPRHLSFCLHTQFTVCPSITLCISNHNGIKVSVKHKLFRSRN